MLLFAPGKSPKTPMLKVGPEYIMLVGSNRTFKK